VALEASGSVEDSNYWKNLVIELMKMIPAAPLGSQVLPGHPSRADKLADRVARRNPKVYDGNLDPVELEDWIREMEKIFTVVARREKNKYRDFLFNWRSRHLVGYCERQITRARAYLGKISRGA